MRKAILLTGLLLLAAALAQFCEAISNRLPTAATIPPEATSSHLDAGPGGSYPLPEPRRDEAVSNARALVHGVGCRLTGRVESQNGDALAAVVRLEVGSDTARYEARTDVEGRFELHMPGGGGPVRLVCEAPPALSGSMKLEVPRDVDVLDVGVIVVRHLVTITARFSIDELQLASLGSAIDCRVRAVLLDVSGGLAALLAPTELAELPIAPAGHREAQAGVVCPPGAFVEWRFRPGSGVEVPLQRDPVPDDVKSFVTQCVIGSRSLLLGRVLAPSGEGLPGVVVQIVVDSPAAQFWELRTDASGKFCSLIAPDAFGVVRVKLLHSTSGDMREGAVPWSPGEWVTLVAELERFIRVRVLLEGQPLARYGLAQRNDPHRDAAGDLDVGNLLDILGADSFVSEFTRIEAGQRLFVRVPGRGEFVHEVRRSWQASDGVLELALIGPIVGRIGFRLAAPLPMSEPAPAVLRAHLVEQGRNISASSYRLEISPQQLAEGWICKQVIPGTYRLTMQWGPRMSEVAVVVGAGSPAWVDVRIE